MGDRVGVKDGTDDDGCSVVVGRTLGVLLGERVGTNEGCIVDGVDIGVMVLGSIVGNALGVKLGIIYCEVIKST